MGFLGGLIGLLGGALIGGIGNLFSRRNQDSQRNIVNDLQKQNADLLAQSRQQLEASRQALQENLAQDAARMAAANSDAQKTIGADPSAAAKRLKFGGINSIATSLFGDTSTPNLAKPKVLSD